MKLIGPPSDALKALREEMIQVAAVAVAVVEDIDYGSADAVAPADTTYDTSQVEEVLAEVLTERMAQDRKWGPQHHTAGEWLAILMEEVGEAAEETPLPEEEDDSAEAQRRLIKAVRRVGKRARHDLDAVMFPLEEWE